MDRAPDCRSKGTGFESGVYKSVLTCLMAAPLELHEDGGHGRVSVRLVHQVGPPEEYGNPVLV